MNEEIAYLTTKLNWAIMRFSLSDSAIIPSRYFSQVDLECGFPRIFDTRFALAEQADGSPRVTIAEIALGIEKIRADE